MQLKLAIALVPAILAMSNASPSPKQVCKNDLILDLLRCSKEGPKISSFCSTYIRTTTTVTQHATNTVVTKITPSPVTSVVTSQSTKVTLSASLIGGSVQPNKRSPSQPIPTELQQLERLEASKISSACSCYLTSLPAPGTKTVQGQTSTVTVATTLAPSTVAGTTTYLTTYVAPSPTCPQAQVHTAGSSTYSLRIEGSSGTIFEGTLDYDWVVSAPGNVTTPSGGKHTCDGTNDGSNPTPGNTPTNSLANAALACGFGFDGTFDAAFDDFFITSIGTSTETATQFWGLLNNYQFTPSGGCQTEVVPSDQTLWMFDAFNFAHFLKLTASATVAPVGGTISLTVVDGSNGDQPISGASVGSSTSNGSGNIQYTCTSEGLFGLKAQLSGSGRSNRVYVYCYTPGSATYVLV